MTRDLSNTRTRTLAADFKQLATELSFIQVMLRNPKLTQEMAARLDKKGVYVAPFSFPVVPRWQDRTHLQMSAAHSREELDRTIDTFIDVGRQMEIIE